MKLGLIAEKLDCTLRGDPNTEITGVRGIEEAGADQLTFVSNRKYAASAKTAGAGSHIGDRGLSGTTHADSPHSESVPGVRTIDRAFLRAAAAGTRHRFQRSSGLLRSNRTECLDWTLCRHRRRRGDRKQCDNRCVYTYRQRSPGLATISGRTLTCRSASVALLETTSFSRTAHALGPTDTAMQRRKTVAITRFLQSGIVVLEDDVEVGANATIDRATVGETRIRRGAKIDNLVQVGHASDVGENTLLCAQVGLSGSSKIGRDVVLTGQVGVAGHLEIGDGVIATAQTGIPNSVEAGQTISGYPAIEKPPVAQMLGRVQTPPRTSESASKPSKSHSPASVLG